MTSQKDWISLIEASYDLSGTSQDWLTKLFACASPLLGCGEEHSAWTFQYTPTTLSSAMFRKVRPECSHG